MSDQEKLRSERIRGKGVQFCRLRRITGYLVNGMERWNSAKLHEAIDRTKNSIN